MIDIHTHILPRIDDGAETYDEAYEMAVIAARNGTHAIVATPHSNHDVGFINYESDQLRQSFEKLNNILKDEKVPLKLYRGMEIWSTMDILEKLSHEKLLTINNTSYVLIEFAFDEEVWWIEAILSELLDAGYYPVIAHPERYYCVQDNPNLLYTWRKMGAYTQMNKGSVLGRFGKHAECTADLLLRHGLFNCIASDAHHAYIRTTDMTDLHRYLEKNYSLSYVELLLEANPLLMIQGKPIKNAAMFRAFD